MSPVLSVYERNVEMNTQCILGMGTCKTLWLICILIFFLALDFGEVYPRKISTLKVDDPLSSLPVSGHLGWL